jgi:type IV pilus assembly protein PilO
MAMTFNDIKKMSAKAKVAVVFLLILLIGYLDWFYFLSAAIEKKNSITAQLTEMQGKIKEKTKIAEQINKYMADVAVLQESYKTALQKLPDQREIPILLHSIASAGRDAGVEFLLFEPKASVPKMLEKQSAAEPKPADTSKAADVKKAPPAEEPLYEEIPVAVSVMGTFQNILYFFDKVAKLPRIVNFSDISMGDRKDVKGKGQLITLSCSIKTYMFLEKKEKASEKTK